MYLFLTSGTSETVSMLAETLVDEGLVACAHLFPAGESIYRWEGVQHREPEQTLLLKVAESQAERLRARLTELHPYALPELVALSVNTGASSPAYLDWVALSASKMDL